jgi:archaemetzincin
MADNSGSSPPEAAYTMFRDVACDHSSLSFTTSTHAGTVGYRQPTAQQRATASGKKKNAGPLRDESFPAPMVLPGDDLSFDPAAPPQSLLSWVREKARNKLTLERNVLYVAGPPEVAANVPWVRRWSVPQQVEKVGQASLTQPVVQDVMRYLAAFYHGMRVKLLPPGDLRFTKWDTSKPKENSGFIGLSTTTESIGIRFRTSPDGIFQGQLNLDDLLDTAISILPDDAYALLMLVEQDLFEDEDDDFCCGRAYGGSRVAVVSMARYNPNLDERQHVERKHSWPASHCEAYMRACCGEPPTARDDSNISKIQEGGAHKSPLQAALAANTTALLKQPPTNPTLLSDRWLSRVCQTASHELGHCFGIDHCVYYACVMQSTASLAEDVRQPPYLCPVDLAKVLRATGADVRDRYAALRGFCRDSDAPMFAAFEAWLGARVAEVGGGGDGGWERSDGAGMGSENMPVEV